jgi:ABC-type glutathione transport system ATPase component
VLLEVRDLRVRYAGAQQDALSVTALQIGANEQVVLSGRSGSGKSTLGLAILQLLPASARQSGTVTFNGAPVSPALRGKNIAWIPQDVTSLSPYDTVGAQLMRPAQVHAKLSRAAASAKAGERIEKLGIAARRLSDYPHKWSGGMLQRALVVMATMAEPQLIIADEPTASVDTQSKSAIASLIAPYAALILSHDPHFGANYRRVMLG